MIFLIPSLYKKKHIIKDNIKFVSSFFYHHPRYLDRKNTVLFFIKAQKAPYIFYRKWTKTVFLLFQHTSHRKTQHNHNYKCELDNDFTRSIMDQKLIKCD